MEAEAKLMPDVPGKDQEESPGPGVSGRDREDSQGPGVSGRDGEDSLGPGVSGGEWEDSASLGVSERDWEDRTALGTLAGTGLRSQTHKLPKQVPAEFSMKPPFSVYGEFGGSHIQVQSHCLQPV